MKKINLIEVKSEIAAGTRGASLGVDAMRVAALNKNSRYFKWHDVYTVKDENYLLLENVDTPFAKRIEGVVKVAERVSDAVRSGLENDAFPVVLAGDHSSAAGTISGIKATYPEKRLGVIWIDAHADLHSPFSTPSGNVHGMPLAAVLGQDNQDRKINEVDEKTLKYWDAFKNTGIEGPKLKAEDLVFFGVRDTEEPEDHFMKKQNITNFTVSEIREKGILKAAEEALQQLNNCDLIYISFDVDSMDSNITAGTGTPVPDGFTVEEANKLMTRLLKDDKVCCFEVVEVNPTLDNKCNLMAENAFRILENATKVVEEKIAENEDKQVIS